MIKINLFYYLIGIVLVIVGSITLVDKKNSKRFTSGIFWLLYGLLFLVGDLIPSYVVGIAVLIMGLLAGFGKVIGVKHREFSYNDRLVRAKQIGAKLFIPALTIPVFVIIGTLVFKNLSIDGKQLIDPKGLTIICVALGCVLATIFACIITREKPQQSMHEMRRLIDTLGWAIVLPQMLAMLGIIFSACGVDKALAHVINDYFNMNWQILAIGLYIFGMAIFTIIMGNAFVAFPIMMGAVGIPSLILHFGFNPALIAAIGMLSGYCGTLMTPMAANFNIIPAALLELKDRNLVIKVQTPSAIMILCANFLFLVIMSYIK
ncbi:MAG: DUF979 domain-containing protein [Proteobacteria bacterium]|nr:MAG: DUF979 domain-containing protein [Pseudomonadota bacterium]